MGRKNQIYARWKRLLPSPDNPYELYLVIEKDKPMDIETIKSFEDRFGGQDVILTITKLIRNKCKRGKKNERK